MKIDGKEYFPSFINGKDITTTDWLDNISSALCGYDCNDEHSFWIYGCLFVAPNPEYYGNKDNTGWFRMVYRKENSDIQSAQKAIIDYLKGEISYMDDFYEHRMELEIVGNDIKYSFWHREIE